MKKRFFKHPGLLMAIATVAIAVGFSSCKKEPTTPPTQPSLEVRYNAEPVDNNFNIPQLDIAGGTRTISVTSNRAWTVTIPAAASWVTASPASGAANTAPATVTLTIAANGGEIRSTPITIRTTEGDKSIVVNVSQKGNVPDVDNMPVADFRNKYMANITSAENQTLELPEDVIFMGTVVSDKAGKNIEAYLFALQDDTAPHSGVVINLTDHTANLGDLVIATCKAGRKAKLFNNLLQVEATSIEVFSGSGEAYEPISVNSTTIRDYESQLVKIEDVQSQSDAAGQTWSGSKVFVNEAGETFTSYVKSAAAFASAELSTGKGYLIGLSGVFGATVQIQPRNVGDTQHLTGARFETTEPKDGKNIIFREDMGAVNVSENTNVNTFAGWTKFGPGAANAVYSTPSQAPATNDATVRSTGVSAGYAVASGGNNIFFGGKDGDKIFTISGIETFGVADLLLGFGLNVPSTDVHVEWSGDGTTWNNIEFTKKSTTWGYTVVDLDVPTTVATISLRFRTAVNSTVRLDDVTVSTDSDLPEAPASFSVSPLAVAVPAAGGDATVNVTANVAWTATVNAGDVNITSGPTPASGNDNQTVTVVFPENTDTENTKEVTLTVTTMANVATKIFTVVFTQAKASGGDLSVVTIDLNSMKDGQTSSFALAVNSYGSQSVDNPYTWAQDGLNFAGVKVAIAGAGDFSGTIQGQGNETTVANQMWIYNTSTITNIKKVTVKFSDSRLAISSSTPPKQYSFYAGSSAKPTASNTVLTEASRTLVEGIIYTSEFDLSSGSYDYFAIHNNLVGALYIWSIEITY